jgi:hypothetical protein
MVLADPGPLLTPPPSSSPPKTPIRSYSAQTPPRNGNPTPPPPGGRGGRRRGRGTGGQNGPQTDADALRHPRHLRSSDGRVRRWEGGSAEGVPHAPEGSAVRRVTLGSKPVITGGWVEGARRVRPGMGLFLGITTIALVRRRRLPKTNSNIFV